MQTNKTIFLPVFPAIIGLGLAWIGTSIIKNESRLLMRKLELQEALQAKDKEIRKKLISGLDKGVKNL